ncbi:hypothetical protein H2199_003634 [Coniosporium tulheliwenetii]|uniref:Uncharacterized protein n=1 Tax=Coniosporium tulheliwenetii TaxID=3383036 RepID=A0ACC2ZAF0_9PEZI|nr:hypothetical protein H2199_003634 [Cladosporium sp. JES 115]
MKPPLRIAILECDTPLTRTKSKYGGYGGVFKSLLEAGADALGQPDLVSSKKGLDITTYDVVNEERYPTLENVDAVLISGSRHNSFENVPWIVKLVEFIKQLLEEQDRVRVIGVCFGHQIVGRAMGVRVDRSDRGWETSVTPVNLTKKGRELFKLDKLMIHQMHKDMVYDYPPGVEELGYTERCAVQGMYRKGRVITVQGHPEFTRDIVTELLETRHNQGIFDDKAFEEAMSRVANRHDGVAVASAFLRFLLED